jgi:hypothetical protein
MIMRLYDFLALDINFSNGLRFQLPIFVIKNTTLLMEQDFNSEPVAKL